MLPGPSRSLPGHQMMRKGSSQPVKDARSVNGYLPIERFILADDALI